MRKGATDAEVEAERLEREKRLGVCFACPAPVVAGFRCCAAHPWQRLACLDCNAKIALRPGQAPERPVPFCPRCAESPEPRRLRASLRMFKRQIARRQLNEERKSERQGDAYRAPRFFYDRRVWPVPPGDTR
jgi:hypothetical protein